MQTLDSLLSQSALAHPSRTAIVDPMVTTTNYRDLDALASRVADILHRHHITPGDRIAVHAPKSVESVAAILGILRAGAAYVPVDPGAPARRNVEIMSDCSVRAVVADEQRSAILAQQMDVQLQVLGEIRASGPSDSTLLLLQFPAETDPQEGPPGLAYILYTSGSTGKPKGVMHTHSSATSFIDWCSSEFAPTADDRFSSHAPFYFDLSILDLFVPIKHGASIVLIGDQIGKGVTLILTPRGHCQLRIGTTLSRVVTSAL